MLDIRLVREKTDEVKRLLAQRRAGDEKKIDELLELDAERRRLLGEVEQLKALRNRVSKEIGLLMKEKRLEEAEDKKSQTRETGKKISEIDAQVAGIEDRRNDLLLNIPNTPHSSVPDGADESDNVTVREWGEKPVFEFEPKIHIDLCESLGLVDFARGAKLAGSGFPLYTGAGARLERALIQFMLDIHTSEHGYHEVQPPFMVNRDCMTGVGQFPKFVDQAYVVQEGEDTETFGKLCMIPTAEAPVANIHRDEILSENELPKYYCAYSPCFRAEAGAAGVGTRGLIRTHQFDKVELIKLVPPENSYDELESMVANAETILQRLGLHYRILHLCTGDMGFASAKTYDIEVWAPGQGQYLEVSSCSNCEDYQARRMNIRYKTGSGEKVLPHILNGSGTALARLFVALIESYQRSDGSVGVPQVLQSYMKTDLIGVS
ncbi:MAG: serine--tRNA ligase [Verrucomicrobia bacterium]|nr:serine--tRNA ligase [Verrucomicrobiota bacterium]